MITLDNDKTWVVRGYEFTSEEETKAACLEYSKIKKIEKKLDYKKPEMVYQLYNKAVDGRIFKTVIGYEYLRKLQKYLLDRNIDSVKVKPIPVEPKPVEKEALQPDNNAKPKNTAKQESKKNSVLPYCVVVLAVMVVVMFVIAMTGNRPNILNYERVIQNKYAQWEAELEEREAVVKEKERELQINSID